MRIPLEFYDQIRGVIRISDVVRQKVTLTQKGNEYTGICPFHSEKTPSFTVNDSKRFYHCFGCSAHGDVIRFVSETSGISYKEAAIKIATDNAIELPKISDAQAQKYEESDHIYKILELASQFFISKLNSSVTEYLAKRGITSESIESFSIGYATGGGELEKFFEKRSIPLKDLLKAGLVARNEDGKIYEIFNKRIMFPIKNIYNKIVGFGGRTMGANMPKYINSPETIVFKKNSTMYGENVATSYSYKDNYSIVVEGYMDVIALHQANFKHAFASLGTSVTENHIQKLWRSSDEIIICLDGDNAGIRAANRLIDMSLPHVTADKTVSFMQLPNNVDPDDFIKSNGSKAFANLLKKRSGLSTKIWDNEYRGKSFNTAESRAILEKKLEEYCNHVNDKTLKVNLKRFFKNSIWNNLVSYKSKESPQTTISSELITSTAHSEIEVLERSICTFIIKYPNVINDIELKDNLLNLNLQDENLDNIKNWIIDITENSDEVDSEMIKNHIKNTRFYDTYLLLSEPHIMFLNLTFLNQNNTNQKQVFEWLCKKHYLLLLKQEYTDMLSQSSDEIQSKTFSYIAEIQKISKELRELSENFAND